MNMRERELAHANAFKLRAEGLSIKEVAERLGVSRGTVGHWLHGVGERVLIRDCQLCGERFVTHSTRRRFCSLSHAQKYRRLFGPPATADLLRERAEHLEDELARLRARLDVVRQAA